MSLYTNANSVQHSNLMAPKEPNKQTQLSARKEGTNRVIKRPARGFHRFRGGVLNVAPKGAEKRMVKENQKSPLLRLPTEIRDYIWKHILGGQTYLAMCFSGMYYSGSYRFAPSAAEPRNRMALLRTCRQVYSEAVLYALNNATFAYKDLAYLKRSVKSLGTYQRKQVTHLRLDCQGPNYPAWKYASKLTGSELDLNKTFPALTRITVLVHQVTDTHHDAYEAIAKILPQQLSRTIEATGAILVVECTPAEVGSFNVDEMDEVDEGKDASSAKEPTQE
ncbi:uncharacterized protein M421DRAFT_89710 [Didymella exigua CBS 183.55]|uniref:Uncharacterized protein n=1 Tax=Didymella exigua CBS 183.55 TaxID=1150837 RepID=A0A6A5RVC8_9PLEO|nr:uncharacterized protein M421DRAFT_89710 [Didymella exigua CBS 183.55]KAF1932425.1 hypothetical protein M421DRAFT_89710 [Didymella exigua CBS 183.55]